MVKRSTIPDSLRRKIIEKSKNRCSFCLAPANLIYSPLEVDHIIPISKGGPDDELNLCAACNACNAHKSARISALDPQTGQRVALFNPAVQNWYEHFSFAKDNATIAGITPTGRATVAALKINDAARLGLRKLWVAAGWYPPED